MEQATVATPLHLPSPSSGTSSTPVLRQLRDLSRNIADPLELAEAQARRLRQLTGQTSGPFHTEAIAKLPKIQLQHNDRLPVPGTVFWAAQGWHIEVNGRLTLPEQRFAALHELKHIIDHPASHRRGRLAINLRELAADYFAACALLPDDVLRAAVGAGTNPQSMARKYRTTTTCLHQRFRDLGLASPGDEKQSEVRS